MERVLAFTYPLNIPDNQFSIVGSADATKTLKFEVDAQTTGDTLTISTGAQTDSRTLSVPVLAGADTLATLAVANVFTAVNAFNNSTPGTSTSSGSVITAGGFASSRANFFRGVASLGDSNAIASVFFANQSVDPAGFRYALDFTTSCSGATAGNSGFTVGIKSDFTNQTAGITHTSASAFYATINTTNATAAITNGYGFYFANGSVTGTSTSKHAFYTEAVTGATNNYAFRAVGAGLVAIGDTTDSTSKDTGSIVTEGGIGVEKALYVGTTLNVTGATTLTGNALIGVSSGTIGTPSHTGAGDALTLRMWNGSADKNGLQLYKGSSGLVGAIVGSEALATNATDGFLYIPSCAGTPTGAPTAHTGRLPLVIDSTNNKLYFYSGGAWRDAGP